MSEECTHCIIFFFRLSRCEVQVVGLCVAAQPWKPISCFVTLLPEAVWNSVMSVATDDRPFYHAMRFGTRLSHSVNLCGLLRRGWAVVAPRCFHFTITAPTVDQGSSSKAEIWQWLVGKVASYDAATLKVIELFSVAHSIANISLWRLHGCVLDFIQLSAMVVAEIAESTN